MDYLKIYFNNESTIIKLNQPKTMNLDDVMQQLKTKNHIDYNISSKLYNWFYYYDNFNTLLLNDNDALSPLTLVHTLLTDSLILKRKVPKANTNTLSDKINSSIQISDYVFSKLDFQQLAYYNVIKTNVRGRKQRRKLGIDYRAIYNHADQRKGIMSRLSHGPYIVERPINTVLSCEQIFNDNSNKTKKFIIKFKDINDSNLIITREYEAETYTECTEIVAKIIFLIKNYETFRKD